MPITQEDLTGVDGAWCMFTGTAPPECKWGCGSNASDVDEMGTVYISSQQMADVNPVAEYAE